MAITYGTHITNFDATPPLAVNSRLHGGYLKGAVDTFELADTANADSHIVFKLPVDAVLFSVKMAADDLGSAGTVDIGFHTKGADGVYAAVDVDAIASAINVNSAATGLTEYRFEAAAIETANQTAWELAGLAARPAYGDIYVSISTPAGTTAVGTVTLQIQYAE
tara:strand:+ start:644 stop:1138 length:495 start_codon:yes stop_codon:yes gene_type:complete